MSFFTLEIVLALNGPELERLCGAGGSPWTCRALVQMLPPLAQHYVLRLATVGDEGVAAELVDRWALPGASDEHGSAVETLRKLRILEVVPDTDVVHYRLRASFAGHLRSALCTPASEPWRLDPVTGADLMPKKPDKKRPTSEQLQQWMVWRWNTVLLFIVGESLDEKSLPNEEVRGFALDAGFMADSDEGVLEITGKGLDFLLKERHEQLWLLLEQYVKASPDDETSHGREELVALILTLAYCRPCEDYPVEALTASQRRSIKVLGALGMVYQKNLNSQRFYPTQLGVAVAFGREEESESETIRTEDLQLIVQTNFQVLAYTDATASTSKLVVALLSLFATLRVRLPNMIVGTITRQAIKSCVARGIKIPQILSFLESHAHPLARKKAEKVEGGRSVPENVVDQMVLWAGEEKRVSFQHGALITLKSDAHFLKAMEHAKGHCSWHDKAKRKLFVDPTIEPTLRKLFGV